jgi:hypothetical protein
MNDTILPHLLLESFSEKDFGHMHFDICITPISNNYGSVTFVDKATKQKFDCKFVTLTTVPDQPKVYITVVMTKGKFWFGADGSQVVCEMPRCAAGKPAHHRHTSKAIAN